VKIQKTFLAPSSPSMPFLVQFLPADQSSGFVCGMKVTVAPDWPKDRISLYK